MYATKYRHNIDGKPGIEQTGGKYLVGLYMVLIERLLWTCRDIGELHVLLRSKRGRAAADRLDELKHSQRLIWWVRDYRQAFDLIRAECPRQLDKLRAVEGDATLPRLGLDDASVTQLQEVSVVFHSAASVRFSEPLSRALASNVYSVEALLRLCDQLPKLEALVHVSTAFSNSERRHVGERVYAAPAPLYAVRALPDTLRRDITHRLIAPKPNTYVFSKALAECVVQEHADTARYAAAIVRPSIVVSALRQPRPGWTESAAGPGGVVLACGKGLLRAFLVEGSARADLVPVDIAADNIIAVAWETATQRQETRSVRVYNVCSQENRVSWRMFRAVALRAVREHPLGGALYYPTLIAVRNWYLYKFLELVLQTVPLHIVDCVTRACRTPMKVRLSSVPARLRDMSAALSYFATREWRFDSHNVTHLQERLTQADREIYNLDVNTVDWEEHLTDFVKGVRAYLLRESDAELPRARRHMHRLRVVHRAVLLVAHAALCALLVYVALALYHVITS
ncbi:putative fatty acyl-CoA reductase CG5065 isoform X2 [Helicoverpa zea]|uniref:putative fatty acyl-CoA reductase CG5065 isoform X2 n=1 Tax=Helicoverpa zea TaxID=7113 RepID=UPI001F56431C|nr:putative fatty acyl-CoA reductase CG5065 isoform X2 [Helicoverpa zea]